MHINKTKVFTPSLAEIPFLLSLFITIIYSISVPEFLHFFGHDHLRSARVKCSDKQARHVWFRKTFLWLKLVQYKVVNAVNIFFNNISLQWIFQWTSSSSRKNVTLFALFLWSVEWSISYLWVAFCCWNVKL